MRSQAFVRFLLFVCLCTVLLCLLSVSTLARSDAAYGYCGDEKEWRMPLWGAVAILAGVAALIGAAVYFLLFLCYKRRK